MVVKDILKLAIRFLGKEELLEDATFLTELPVGYLDDPARQKQIEQLLLCFNLIYNELARDYLPLFTGEEIVFEDGKFFYSNLSKVMLDIHKLTSLHGRNIKYKMFPTYISANIDKAYLEYSYEPDELTYENEIENFSSRIPTRVFAYGIAMEYSFLVSESTEALIWESRYKDALLLIKRKKSEVTLPIRRWI